MPIYTRSEAVRIHPPNSSFFSDQKSCTLSVTWDPPLVLHPGGRRLQPDRAGETAGGDMGEHGKTRLRVYELQAKDSKLPQPQSAAVKPALSFNRMLVDNPLENVECDSHYSNRDRCPYNPRPGGRQQMCPGSHFILHHNPKSNSR